MPDEPTPRVLFEWPGGKLLEREVGRGVTFLQGEHGGFRGPGWDPHTCELLHALLARVAELETGAGSRDRERLDFIERELYGCAILSDDCGNWTISTTGSQILPDEPGKPSDIWTCFEVPAEDWHPSLREAVDHATAEGPYDDSTPCGPPPPPARRP